SKCHKIVKKSLSIRTHRCPFCTFVANRDHNAARNVLRIGLRYVNAARRLDARQFIAGSSHLGFLDFRKKKDNARQNRFTSRQKVNACLNPSAV
ncbi:MAG: transposase, partial [Desulfobacteraceae bacterium]|nr:transposase [Desulfobacteraceae bacterium]